jgi:small-conductance mechanosensitive channel
VSVQLLNSSGETNSSPPTQAVPRGNRAGAEKARLQQEIQDLTEQVATQGLAHSTPPSTTVNPDDANPRLLEEIKMLRNRMSALQQQQMQMQAVIDQGLPEYTSSPT